MEDHKDMETKLVPGVGRLPYPAYRGKEPYVFISYAHDDQDIVFSEIKRFNEAGFYNGPLVKTTQQKNIVNAFRPF